MELKKKVLNTFLERDLFGKDIHLTIKKSDTHKTFVGAFITLLIYSFLVFTIV
jgi:hypothetical protein